MSFPPPPPQDICSNSSAGPSKSILTVGMLRSKLLVLSEPDNITFTQYIYEMPASSLNDSADELFLNDEPQTLKSHWPVLYSNEYYMNTVFNGHIYNSFTAVDSVGEYLFLTTLLEEAGSVGVVYDIANGKAYKGMQKNKGIREVLISSDKLQKFFAVQIDGQGGLAMMRFKFTEETVLKSVAKVDGIVPEDRGAYYPLCKVGPDSMKMLKKKRKADGEDDDKKDDKNSIDMACEPLKYPLSKGFVSKDKIYLFGQDKIYIFPESFYDNPNKPVKVIAKSYSSFINCKTVVDQKTDKVTGKVEEAKNDCVIVIVIPHSHSCLFGFFA